MWWIILIVLVLGLACYLSFKYGEVYELHKTRAAFEHYLEAHPLLNEDTVLGIELAENIIDNLVEEEIIL